MTLLLTLLIVWVKAKDVNNARIRVNSIFFILLLLVVVIEVVIVVRFPDINVRRT